jgi:hypothetical protein
MKTIAIYDPGTGAIRSVKLVQDAMVAENTPPGWASMEVGEDVQPGTWYVDLNTLECHACQPFALAYPGSNQLTVGDTLVIGNVPEGTSFQQGSNTHIVTGGDFEWPATEAGAFGFFIDHPEYIGEEYLIEVS